MSARRVRALIEEGVSPPVAALIEKLFNRFRTTDDWVHAALTLPDLVETEQDREHAVSALCRRLERNALLRKRVSPVRVRVDAIVTALAAVLAIVITIAVFSRITLPDYWIWIYYPATSWLGTRAGDRLNRRRENSDEVRAACARSLGVMGDPAAVPVLARYLIVTDEKLAFESRRSLQRLFSNSNGADLPDLSAETSENIASSLGQLTGEQAEVFLRELLRRGSPSALDDVQNLVAGLPVCSMRNLASQTVQALQQRRDVARHRSSLLRPSAGDVEALLRPSASAPADPSLLLRQGEEPS